MPTPNEPDDPTGKGQNNAERESPGQLEEQRQRQHAGQQLAEEIEERESVDADIAADDAQLDEPADDRR
jgi:hypothetical protein